MVWLPFQKTKTIKCPPDGRPVTVYRYANDAFPVLAIESTSAGKAAVNALDEVNLEVGAKFKQEIKEIRSQLDDANRGTWDAFYSVYVPFQADPCGQVNYLASEMKLIREREYRLRSTITTLKRIRDLKESGASDDTIQNVLNETYDILKQDRKADNAADHGQARDRVEAWSKPA